MSHSKLGPSSSHRWINCPGSLSLINKGYADGLIKPSTSSYAEEGTKAHDLAAKMLLKADGLFADVPEEMRMHVMGYVDFVLSHVNTFVDPELLIEEEISYSDWVAGGWGTVDAAVISRDTISIVDFKYGMGVVVDAIDNTQLLLYALGVYQGLSLTSRDKISDVSMYIYQPRIDNISEWHITKEELLQRAEEISAAAELALTDDAPLSVGDWCRFCPAHPICPAQYELLTDTVGVDFDNLDSPADLLTPADLSRVLSARSKIEAWLKAASDYAMERLLSGDDVPGYKVVAGRSLRQWADDEMAAAALEIVLGDGAYSRKLLSPSQAENALGKKGAAVLDGMIVKPEGAPTIAAIDDPRPAIKNIIDSFEVL